MNFKINFYIPNTQWAAMRGGQASTGHKEPMHMLLSLFLRVFGTKNTIPVSFETQK